LASAASQPVPSPSAFTCVVSTTCRAESSAARTRASGSRRPAGIVSTPLTNAPGVSARGLPRRGAGAAFARTRSSVSPCGTPFPQLCEGRCNVHSPGREPAVDPPLPKRGQEGGRLVLEGRDLDVRPSHLRERVRIRAGTHRHAVRRRPFHGTVVQALEVDPRVEPLDRKSTRLNSSHVKISYAVFC